MSEPIPPAAAPGDAKPAGPPGKRPVYKRKLSNYLLDAKLQLPYLLFVTILSGLIAGALGWLIYNQRHTASASIVKDLAELGQGSGIDFDKSDFKEVANGLEADDRMLVYKMVGVGIGLVVILSAYLVIMTHKVAGPLYKVSMYFDRMADGRLGNVTPLRQGDMLQDFYLTFSEMHASVRGRFAEDATEMEAALAALREAGNHADYRGHLHGDFTAQLGQLEAHLAARRKQLA